MLLAFNSVPVDPISIDIANPQQHQYAPLSLLFADWSWHILSNAPLNLPACRFQTNSHWMLSKLLLCILEGIFRSWSLSILPRTTLQWEWMMQVSIWVPPPHSSPASIPPEPHHDQGTALSCCERACSWAVYWYFWWDPLPNTCSIICPSWGCSPPSQTFWKPPWHCAWTPLWYSGVKNRI